MDYKHSIAILSENIDEIDDILRGLEKSKKIPAIEVDLLLDKVRNFYEMLLMLKKNIGEFEETKYVAEKQPEKAPEPVVTVPEVKKPANEVIEMPAIHPPVKDLPKEVKVQEPVQNEEQKILSDRFKKGSSLNETVGQTKSYQDLSSKLQSKPIMNISSGIGLNEKFSFIHTLFRGDTNKYNETIQILNNVSNFNEAYNYLNEHFDWDMNSEPVQKILDLIRRKFIVNKNG